MRFEPSASTRAAPGFRFDGAVERELPSVARVTPRASSSPSVSEGEGEGDAEGSGEAAPLAAGELDDPAVEDAVAEEHVAAQVDCAHDAARRRLRRQCGVIF